jgi:sulfite exporter TauE/SafE
MNEQTAFQGFLSGMGLMLAFGVGTVPSLLLVGKLAGLGWIKARPLIYKISSVFMVLVGIYFIIQGIRY